MAHYLFNFVGDAARASSPREQAGDLLRAKMWGVDDGERHRDALAPGDLVLIYLAADRTFVGRAELASRARDWTPPEARVYPDGSRGGVLLSEVEGWDHPVPIGTVLSRLAPTEKARAEFDTDIVRITENEYETVLTVSAERQDPTG